MSDEWGVCELLFQHYYSLHSSGVFGVKRLGHVKESRNGKRTTMRTATFWRGIRLSNPFTEGNLAR